MPRTRREGRTVNRLLFPGRRPVSRLFLAGALLATACARPSSSSLSPSVSGGAPSLFASSSAEKSCRKPAVYDPVPIRSSAMTSPSLGKELDNERNPVARLGPRWTRPAGAEARSRLDRWCRAVGPPLVSSLAGSGPIHSGLDHLPIVAWNVHVGGADLDALIRDLRSGVLTGTPEHHFVLLLQEARRLGGGVPDEIPPMARAAERIAAREYGASSSIDRVAARHDLHLLYVPSMRNGRPGDEGNPEDRGNAILSTLPLSEAQAIELPVQSQRRVAVAATISPAANSEEGTPASRPWSLRVVSVHLDHRSEWRRIHESLGVGRARQAQRLTDILQGEDAVTVGGDLNTWFGGAGEKAVELMREALPLPREVPDRPTLDTPFLPDRTVDHLFFRLPVGWSAAYHVAESTYGSDHRPLVGRVTFDSVTDDFDSRIVE